MHIRSIMMSLLLIFFIASLSISQSTVHESFEYPLTTIAGLGTASGGFGDAWFVHEEGGVEGLAAIGQGFFNYADLNWAIPVASTDSTHIQVNKKRAWADHMRYKRPLAETWPNEAGKIYWVSYLLDVKEPLPAGNTYFMVKLYYDDGELLAIGKGGGRDTSPPVWTCGSGWPGMSGDDVSEVEILGGPVWLVVRIDMSGGTGVERTFMWVDPDPSAEPDTNAAIVKRNSNMPSGFNSIALEYGGDGPDVTLVFDEIKIASEYADLTTSIRLVQNLPYQFVLSQNYPNPFNPSTTISYTIQNRTQVDLSVYDLLGRKVAVLVDGVQNAGEHVLSFSGADLPSGIYYYTLKTDNGMITKKMVLLK